ncbi:Aste57867_13822 [Aphanomyces stellatus]|uniref:Aste57867_13822 protein n=1 Tax=Aphanomyces stellatus TaxID=120398 RepID=A0A485KZT4_9STRA|nr:hypothetical protein As57867_013772 [Aphanomyces stellatus]VFT90654.1 Aste57867_13822 [Aphanomyces stellatus]
MAASWASFFAESKLAIALVLLILARCVDRVIYTRIIYDYGPFLWYFSNIICPVAFAVTSWPVVWYKMLFTKDITPEMKAFPKHKFAIMAFLDSLFNLMAAFPTPHIGGNLANVLGQLLLPFNMALSFFFLKTKYKRTHILGAILVIYGGLVDMIPLMQGSGAANSPDPSVWWISLYLLAMIPGAGSNVYKEIGLKDVDLDIWYTNAWVSLYQILWGLTTVWTIQVPAFNNPPVTWSEFPSYAVAAHKCFMGENVTLNDKFLPCNEGIAMQVAIFFAFNLVFNQLMLYVFKEGSSVLFVVSSAVCLPLTDILYMFPMLTGAKASQTFTLHDGFAIFVLVMGMLVYHAEKEQRLDPSGTKAVEKSPMFSSPSFNKTQMMRAKRGRVLYHQSPVTYRSRNQSPSRPLLAMRNPATMNYGTEQV